MLTTEDIQKLSSYLKEDLKDTFATKEDLRTEIGRIDHKLDSLLNAVDSFAKEIKDNRSERVVMEERVTRAEKAIQLLAKHTGAPVSL